MNLAVHKFILNDFSGTIEVSHYHKIIKNAVKTQYGKLVMYCMVDLDEKADVKLRYEIVGTGLPLQDKNFNVDHYNSTIMLDGGSVVLHAFIRLY